MDLSVPPLPLKAVFMPDRTPAALYIYGFIILYTIQWPIGRRERERRDWAGKIAVPESFLMGWEWNNEGETVHNGTQYIASSLFHLFAVRRSPNPPRILGPLSPLPRSSGCAQNLVVDQISTLKGKRDLLPDKTKTVEEAFPT